MSQNNWDSSSGWWNSPQDEQRQQPAQQRTAQAEADSSDPSPEDIVRSIAREEHSRATQDYAKWAAERKAGYEQASAKFLADKELAPYFQIAQTYFLDQDGNTQQRLPVSQLYDMTVRHVQNLKQLGVKPPEAPSQRGLGGGAGSQNAYGIPLEEQQGNGALPFRRITQEEIDRQNEDYLYERRADLDKRKFRGTEDDFVKLEQMRKQQRDNRMQLERA